MNSQARLFSLVLLAGALTPAWAANPSPAAASSASAGPVEVIFVEPDKFTDLSSSYARQTADAGYLEELQRHIERTAARRLASGQRLVVRITDVDMAGEFEPQRGPRFSDTRIVRDIYPPRINLEYTLTDASGQVLEQGEKQLRDLGFNHHVDPLSRSDSLRHEKRLLSDWLRTLGRS